MKPSRLSILLVLAGCGNDPSNIEGDITPRSVEPDAPAADSTNVDNGNDIPALGLYWYGAGAYELSGPSDLGAASTFTSTSNPGWKVAATTKLHTISPAFPDVLNEAASRAADHADGADAGLLDDIINGLEYAVPPPIKVDFAAGEPSSKWAGFSPLHARWITQDIAPLGPDYEMGQAETVTDYIAPAMFDDSRLRGARMYCSARRAREEQGNGSPTMGRQSAVEFSLFGTPIRLLTVEPRVQLSNPERIALETDGLDVDGAQAFAIPMTLGTSFELASFLPSLPELRTPVSLITADTEVETGALRRPIATGGVTCTVGGDCYPNTEIGYARTYQTATHVDGVAVGSYSRQTEPDGVYVPLGRLGPLELWLSGLAAIRLGQTSWANWNAANGPNIPVGIVNDRVLGNYNPTGAATRSGEVHVNPGGFAYNDAPWDLYTSDMAYPNWAWSVGNPSPWQIPLYGANPAVEYVRPLQNDDHAFTIGNEFHFEVEANAGLVSNFSLGPFSLSGPSFSGGLAATLRQSFEFRDALHAQGGDAGGNPALPTTGVTIQPRTAALASTTPITARMTLSLDLLFSTIEIKFKFNIVPGVDLAEFDSANDDAWGEESRFRMGTGGVSDFQQHFTRDSPLVASHLAGRPDYLPFDDQDVASCLEEPELDLDDTEPCEPTESDNQPLPSAEVCLVLDPYNESEELALPALSASACGNIGQYASSEPGGVSECLQGMLSFMCDPVSNVQLEGGHWVVARVIEWNDPFLEELAERLMNCSQAWSETYAEYDEQALVDALVRTQACDSEGNLLDADDIFSSSATPQTSPLVSPPNECQ